MKKITLLPMILLLCLSVATADDNPMNSIGIEPTYSYKGGLNEAINLFNGNLSVSISLLSLKGRAGLDLNLGLSYNSRQFRFWGQHPYDGIDWNYTGPTMGHWFGNFDPYVREWTTYDLGFPIYHAEVTLETGSKNEFVTDSPNSTLGLSTNASDMRYHFDSKILSTKSGIWYDFSVTDRIRKGDANGNYIEYTFQNSGGYRRISQIVDTLGRTVNFYYDDQNNVFLLTRMTVLNNAGAVLTYSFEYQQRTINPASYGYEISYISDPVWVLTGINLPDGKSWVFTYGSSHPNPSGVHLMRIDYPMGGYTRYEYQLIVPSPAQLDFGLWKKITNANNGQGEITTTYTLNHEYISHPTVENPDGSTETAYFDQSGHEFLRHIKNPAGNLLRRIDTGTVQYNDGYNKGAFVTERQYYLENQLSKAISYTYDANHDVIQASLTGATFGSPVPVSTRTTTKTYLTISVPRSGQAVPYLISRLQEESVSDARSGTPAVLISKTQYHYDQFALTNRSGVASHDASFGTSFTTRGNLTTTSRWLASESRYIDTKTYYDILGSAVQTTDARNYSTTINYSAAFQYAYPTQVVNAKGQTVNTNYSFNTGQVLSVTDANGHTTTTTYDSLNRATRIDSPDGGYIRATYDLTSNNFSSTVYKVVATENAPPPPAAPQNLLASVTSPSQILLSWTPSSSSPVSYEAARYPYTSYSGVNASCTPSSCTWTDSNVTAGNAYAYRVRAVNTHGLYSDPSNADIATTILFTDDPLVQSVTTVKSIHLAELRQAVAAARSCAGMAVPSWTDASPTPGVLIKATHLQELRSQLNPAFTQLQVSAPGYTDPTITAGVTPIKAAHFQEIRQAVK